MKAIEILRASEGRAEEVERAIAMHDACTLCGGMGGNAYYPEQACGECGFSFADSYGVESIRRPEDPNVLDAPGRNKLWQYFGLSYATWLTLPRVLMHEMPSDWQAKMAKLLEQFEATWDTAHMPSPYVSARDAGNRWTRWPAFLLNYRHPDASEIDKLRRG